MFNKCEILFLPKYYMATKRKILPTFVLPKTKRMNEQPKKEEIIRKSLDLPKSAVDALTIQAVKKGFKNFKKYCESILKDVSKQK